MFDDLLWPFRITTLRNTARVSLWIANRLMCLLSASAEIFLHGNFGRRYLPTLLLAFVFSLCCTGFQPRIAVPSAIFLVGSFLLTVHHYSFAWSRPRRRLPEPHTFSTGDSWNLWQHLRIEQTAAQRYAEPPWCLLVGLALLPFDPALSTWLQAAALSLAVKGQISRIKSARKIMDAADARLAAQKLNHGLNRYLNRANQGAQRAHAARLPRRP